MRKAIARFLRHLEVERATSPHTTRSYRADLMGLAAYLEDESGKLPDPSSITVHELRRFVTALNEAGYAKSSLSRQLAAVRSFFAFGQREGWAESNPARPLRNPRKGRH